MYTPLITSIMAMLISALLFILAKTLNSRTESDREKTSPFECGFDPKNNARVPFSLRFFMLAIIFIVFDIEIVLLMPTPMLSLMVNTSQSLITTMMFMMILLMGLFHEWLEGSLNWSS